MRRKAMASEAKVAEYVSKHYPYAQEMKLPVSNGVEWIDGSGTVAAYNYNTGSGYVMEKEAEKRKP